MRFSCTFFFAVVLILGACSSVRTSEPVWNDSRADLVWPDPPEKGRIRFLRSLGEADDFREVAGSGRFLRWVAGEEERKSPLRNPYGVAADGMGRVWVADPPGRTVHVFDLARRKHSYFEMAGGERFVSPVGVAFDPAGKRLYVSDSVLKKVFVLDEKGQLIGTLFPPEGYGRPGGLAADGEGNVYVVDVLRGKVEVFSREGVHSKSIGSAVNPDGEFNRPSNVFVDRTGRIYVLDAMNFRVEILGTGGEPLGTVGELGDVPGTFARPRGVAVDSDGHIYVSDAAFDNIQIFDADDRLMLFFGGVGPEPGQFSLPAGLFIDANGRLYVADAYNHRVQIFQYISQGAEGGK